MDPVAHILDQNEVSLLPICDGQALIAGRSFRTLGRFEALWVERLVDPA